MSSFMAFSCIRLALLSEVGFPCLCGSERAYVFVCVWETESEQEEGEGEKVKTDKSCQLAVLPHNFLTASLSSGGKKREKIHFYSPPQIFKGWKQFLERNSDNQHWVPFFGGGSFYEHFTASICFWWYTRKLWSNSCYFWKKSFSVIKSVFCSQYRKNVIVHDSHLNSYRKSTGELKLWGSPWMCCCWERNCLNEGWTQVQLHLELNVLLT